jgi:hypothetical protein
MKYDYIYIYIIGFAVMSLVFAQYSNVVSRESFRDTYSSTPKFLNTSSDRVSGPADATITEPRDPYYLLNDYMKPAGDQTVNITSENMYGANVTRCIEKTGSYGQYTNNYQHKKPDNGSTPFRELSVSFYG